MNSRITFIGAGNMASSIIGGLINSGVDPALLTVTDPSEPQLNKIASTFRVGTSSDNQVSVKPSDIIVLAVKPDVVASVCREIGAALSQNSLIVSIAAGIRAGVIERWLGIEAPIIRCMPNTPALLSSGASALYSNEACSQAHRDLAETLMKSAGITVWVEEESQIDAVTALSGSGPAYFFHLIECMTASAMKMGLPPDTAETLAIETAYGAARMARLRTDSPAQLRQNVTSKGGTTAAALTSFQQDQFDDIVHRAMEAARSRAKSLADELSSEPDDGVV